MGKYRKKPVVIEAFQWQPDASPYDAPQWLMDAFAPPERIIKTNPDRSCTIRTLEGDHRCDVGDFIIQGVKGEIYPCKADIFAQTYEPVEEAQ